MSIQHKVENEPVKYLKIPESTHKRLKEKAKSKGKVLKFYVPELIETAIDLQEQLESQIAIAQ